MALRKSAWWQRVSLWCAAAAVAGASWAGSAAASSPVTVTLWSWSPLSTTMQKMVAAFEKAHPGIVIKPQIQPSSTYWTSLKAAAASGTLPDIIGLSAGVNTQLYRPFLQPLNSFAARSWGSNWRSRFPLAVDHQMLLGNPKGNHNVYMLPEEAEVLNVWYNRQIFKKLHLAIPRTLPQLVKVSRALDKAGYIAFFQGAEAANFDQWMFMELADQTDQTGMLEAQIGKPTWTQPGMVRAMAAWKQLFTDGVIQQGALGQFQYPTGANLFAAGRVGMMLLGSWWLQEAELPPPQPAEVKNLQAFGTFPFPAITPGGHPSPYIGGIDVGFGLTKAAKAHEAAAEAVLKSIVSGRMEQQALNTLNDLPAFAGFKPTIPLTRHLNALYTRYLKILPHTISHEIGNPVIGQALVNAMQGVASGKLTPSQGMASVNAVAIQQEKSGS